MKTSELGSISIVHSLVVIQCDYSTCTVLLPGTPTRLEGEQIRKEDTEQIGPLVVVLL